MAEITRTINGHKYKYLSYWDKDKKERRQVYLGRLTDDDRLIPPVGNVPLATIIDAVNQTEKLAVLIGDKVDRNEIWNGMINELKKYHKHEIHSFRNHLKREVTALFKLLILIIVMISAYLLTNMLFDSGII